jgi:site-specific recombinase XerC
MEEHGESCETYTDARHFLKEISSFMEQAEKDEWGEIATLKLENEKEAIEKEFEHAILQDYLSMLKKEYEWLMSDEQVDESIIGNQYEFTEDGEIV